MATEQHGQQAIESSPLQVEVSNPDLLNDDPFMMRNWMSPKASPILTTVKNNVDPAPLSEESPSSPSPIRPTFIVHIFPGVWPHKRHIRSSPFHGAWASFDGDRAAPYTSADLGKDIISGVGTDGFKTWDLESLRYSQNARNVRFYQQRVERRDVTYQGAVPELMTKRRKVLREAGLLGKGAFASYGDRFGPEESWGSSTNRGSAKGGGSSQNGTD